MVLTIPFPVFVNVEVAIGESPIHGYITMPSPDPLPVKYMTDQWTHPGYTTDPRCMIAAVARARGLITRTIAATVTKTKPPAVTSVPAHVARLAAKWELVAYSVTPAAFKTELVANGPFVATVPVTNDLLHDLGVLLGTSTPRLPPTHHGNIIVAVLGWEAEKWIVALPWGRFPMWNGTLMVDHGLNACALARQEKVRQVKPGLCVTVLPPDWTPLTTKPLPDATVGIARGKHQTLRKRPSFPDEHLGLTVQCVVTMVIIVVGVILLIMLRRKY